MEEEEEEEYCLVKLLGSSAIMGAAFDIKLESFKASSKLKIIKEVRTFTDLGLKDTKELVEKAPCVLKVGVSKEDADEIVEKLKAIGAKAVLVFSSFLKSARKMETDLDQL